MKGDDSSKHPKRDKLYKIREDFYKFWKKFKASVMYVQDPELKRRLQTCVNSISDPFSTEIWCHDYCRKKYLQPIYSTDETSERNLQNMTEKNVEQNFINYVNETIFNNEELRALKNLCKSYSNMLENFGFYKTVKSDRIKDLLIRHF